MTPMLTRIEQDLAQCTDPIRSAELQAERASYLARMGEFAEAKEILAALRTTYSDGRSARVSVWIMLAEGLILYFEGFDPRARDRILRANAISDAVGLTEMLLLTAAWLAHIDFNRTDFVSMFAILRRSVKLPLSDLNSANLRFGLVLADSLMYCGNIAQARLWYEKTRQWSVQLGDEATLAAMIYNKAAIGLCRLRIEAVNGDVDSSLVKFVAMEIASAYNFQIGAGHKALPHIIDACRVRVLLLQHRFAEALPMLSALLDQELLRFGLRPDQILLQIEYCQCLLRVGNRSRATEVFERIPMDDFVKMSCDDRFIFLSTYKALTEELGLSSIAMACGEKIMKCKEELEMEMKVLRAGLNEVLCLNA